MALSKQSGNLYDWVTHSWNPLAGACPHQCAYCYVSHLKRFPVIAHKYSGPLRLDEKALQDNLGRDRHIFVGSCGDMFADLVPTFWIRRVLDHCNEFPNNEYLFQTKNPRRLCAWTAFDFPANALCGTTLESNRDHGVSLAPPPFERFLAFYGATPFPKMVTVEPIMDFDLDIFVSWLSSIKPMFISIGADSKGHHLPEPGPDKIRALIAQLEQFTAVKPKSNLQRLLR